MALAEIGAPTICLSTLSFSNLNYLMRRLKGHDDALGLLGKLKRLARVSAVTEVEIESALWTSFKDFEDAIGHYAVKAERDISATVARNKADYSARDIPVLSPTSISPSANRRQADPSRFPMRFIGLPCPILPCYLKSA